MESHWRKQKAAGESGKPLKKVRKPLKKAESQIRKEKADLGKSNFV